MKGRMTMMMMGNRMALVAFTTLGAGLLGCDDGDSGATPTPDMAQVDMAGGAGGEGGAGGMGGAGGEAGMGGAGGAGGMGGEGGEGGAGGEGGGTPPGAPVITQLDAYLNRQDGGFGFIIEGADMENDVIGFSIAVWDANDEPIRFDEDGGSVDVAFNNLSQGLGNFRAFWSVSFNIDSRFGGMSKVEIGVLDGAMNRSATIIPEFQEAPEVDRDENCDINRGLSRCYDGDLCGTLAGGRYSCQPQSIECPDYFMAIDLNAEAGWTYDGNTDGTGSHASGHCGGGSGDQVFRFVPPEAGTYSIRAEVDMPGGDPLLYVRSHCRFPDVTAELGCNDDVNTAGGDLSSRLDLALPADEPIFIFVDGYDHGDQMREPWRGPYRLVVERQELTPPEE